MRNPICAAILCLLLSQGAMAAELWQQPQRGGWLASESDRSSLTLVKDDVVVDIVVPDKAHSAVRRAALFLAADIEKISGRMPAIVRQARDNVPSIRLATQGKTTTPMQLAASEMAGQWEAYRIRTIDNAIWLVGSNSRGTAFAAYTLSERLGIDPLYHWTGYQPERRETLAVKPINFRSGEPTFKYRGLFHDDEDVLATPLDKNGYPQYDGGSIDPIWYQRYFETALRLRMNQVAPFVRVVRPYAVQKMASDWGLFYSSHHYDILLSNPFGYERFGLATQRGVSGNYDWSTNQKGILKYWRGGVAENRQLDAIWPVGLRGTADTAYQFPDGTTQAQKNQVFANAIQDQVDMTKAMLPSEKMPVFHFTLYGEMLRAYQSGEFDFPEEVILVWNDTGDGIMRSLPESLGKWKHGIYYHLAYYGATTKQTHRTIAPARIEQEFRNIVKSGATEYLLLNVSELRQHVMNTRFIADITWNAAAAFKKPNAAGRYLDWWSQEYFGSAAQGSARDSYDAYFDILHAHDQILEGARNFDAALNKFSFRLKGDHHVHYTQADLTKLEELQARLTRYEAAFQSVTAAKQAMNAQQQRFFFEDVELGLLMDYFPTKAASQVNAALRQYPDEKALAGAREALETLEQLELELRKAERPPFEHWYRPTWIRRVDSRTNPHYSHTRLKNYLENYVPRYK